MDFYDIFKKSFLDGFSANDINIYTAATAMMITCLLALYIFVVYRVITRKTFYNKSFNISLAGVALITSGIILTTQSSVVLSLGMIGALSIVRFRSAVKDPMDLMFLFWSMSVGMICGVGLAEIAIILSIMLTVGIIVLNILPIAKAPKLLIVNVSGVAAEDKVMAIIKKYGRAAVVKAKNMSKTNLELIIELRTNKGNDLIQEIVDIEEVESATLMCHDGEVTF